MNHLLLALALSLSACSTTIVVVVKADKLDETLAAAIFPETSSLCTGAGTKTSFSTSYTSTDSTSNWNAKNKPYESNVFEVDMIHDDDDDNRDWRLRLGKGGQISSFIIAAGECIANQAVEKAAWNDLVQQMVAVNGNLNEDGYPNFIHQAGPYMKDTGMPPPFYSPNVALHCEENDCATINWGQQAHVPIHFDSPLLYYTRYRDCGDGVIEYDMAMHHFGQDSTDVYDFFNTPWTGIRTSNFRDMLVANKDTQDLERVWPLKNWGGDLRNLEDTGGFTSFAQDLPLTTEQAETFQYIRCVDSANNNAPADCDDDPTSSIVDYAFAVRDGGDPAQEQAFHAGQYEIQYAVSMAICVSGSDDYTGASNWGYHTDGVVLKNDNTGYTFKSDYLIHMCVDGKVWMGSSVTADELNNEFLAGHTISVLINAEGLPEDEQQAFTFVHGTNPEYDSSVSTAASGYRAKSRMRYGTTPSNTRDGTVWTTNWLGKLEQTQTYFNRKYMVIDKLDQTKAQAAPLSAETFEMRSPIEELPEGEKISLWKDTSSFGFTIGDTATTCGTADVVCVGRSVPIDGGRPWFYVTCGNNRITTTDPYVYTVDVLDVTTSYLNRKPYLCQGETENTRADWKLLGFFSEDCTAIESNQYNLNLCDTAVDGYFCPEQNSNLVTDAPLTCAMTADVICDSACTENWCTFLNGGPSASNSGGRELSPVAARECDAGFAYDWDSRICVPIDECLTDNPCSLDEGSYCVDQFPEYRYECGCRVGYQATAYPIATTLNDYNGVILEAFVEQAVSETGMVFNYSVPIKFRPFGCIPIISSSPSTVSSLDDFVGEDLTDEDDEEFREELTCENNFGRRCTDASEYCGRYENIDGDFAAACLCKPGFEKALGDPVTSMRGCVVVDKCNSPDWNYCSVYATCKDDFPGTPAAVRCDCKIGYEGGGGYCQVTKPPTPAPTTAAPIAPTAAPNPGISPPPTNSRVPGCSPRPCANDCGFGSSSASNTCQGCRCKCDEGATLTTDGSNVCMASRPGATFDSDSGQCIFAGCPSALEYILERTNSTHTSCVTLTRTNCDQSCAERRCTAGGGTFLAGSTGTTWETAHFCRWGYE